MIIRVPKKIYVAITSPYQLMLDLFHFLFPEDNFLHSLKYFDDIVTSQYINTFVATGTVLNVDKYTYIKRGL